MILRKGFWVLVVLMLSLLGTATVQAGDARSRQLSIEKLGRSYLLYRPAGLDHQKPVPLVIMLHGGFGSARQAEDSYGWDKLADKQGFVVVYPDGTGHSWNAGGICCGPALRREIADVEFLDRLIAAVSRAENIDPARVYLTGISNGAAMSYRYACEGNYPVAAIGAVSGSFSFECDKVHAVSLMAIHGTADQRIPFAGGAGKKGVTNGAWISVPHSLDAFRAANNCKPPVTERAGLKTTETSECEQGREIVLITIQGAGHQWPGGKARRGLVNKILKTDTPSTELDATATLWDFFQEHPAQH